MGSSEISSKVDVSRSVGCLIIASVHLWSVAANPLKKQHTHIKCQRTHALLDSMAQMPKNTCTAGLHSSNAKEHMHCWTPWLKCQRTHALLDSTAQMPKNTCTAGLHSSNAKEHMHCWTPWLKCQRTHALLDSTAPHPALAI